MEKIQPITYSPSRTVNGGQVAPQRAADHNSRPARRDMNAPQCVSWSSALNEEDRRYRGTMHIESGKELAIRSVRGIAEIDAEIQQTFIEGTSLLGLAAAEQMLTTFGRGARYMLEDFLIRPYRRW